MILNRPREVLVRLERGQGRVRPASGSGADVPVLSAESEGRSSSPVRLGCQRVREPGVGLMARFTHEDAQVIAAAAAQPIGDEAFSTP